ncbi:MAG: hypothetical protein ACWA5L_02435 [bacterium]
MERQSPELRISIAISTALIIQTAIAFIWAGSVSERLAQLERRVATTAELSERTARLEEQVVYMRVSLERIEEKLDKTEGRP